MEYIILAICLAGALGGIVNALISGNNDIILPTYLIVPGDDETALDDDGSGSKRKKGNKHLHDQKIWRPGVIGNVFTGTIAAFISWGLYGPLADYVILPHNPDQQQKATLTLSALVGAVLIGVGGARWLTNEVDKSLLQKAAVKSAASGPDSAKAAEMASATPARAVAIAYGL